MKVPKWIEKSAMIGSRRGRALLAYMHYYGQGTLIDKKQAFNWLSSAVKYDDAVSQYLYGYMYYYGEVTIIDKKEAAKWMKKAFENGSKEAKEFWDEHELWRYK